MFIPVISKVSTITVYQQMEDRNNVMVTCTSEIMLNGGFSRLSVESDQNHTLSKITCIFNESCVFMVKVTPPVSFTCLHGFGNSTVFRSETYGQSAMVYIHFKKIEFESQPVIYFMSVTFSSVLDHHKEGVSSIYLGFCSFIAVGLIIMTVAVIVSNAWSKNKGECLLVNNFTVCSIGHYDTSLL